MNLTPRAYSSDPKPFAGYLGLMSVYTAVLAVTVLCVRKSAARTPLSAFDLLLLGVATHKLSRIATRDRLLSPLRAPFTHYEGSAGFGEVEEEVRGKGEIKAVGELVTCPYCASPWIAAPLALAMQVWRGPARFLCGIFSAVTTSHFLHQYYRLLAEKK